MIELVAGLPGRVIGLSGNYLLSEATEGENK